MNDFHVRPVTHENVDSFFALMDAHADFEKMPRPPADARARLLKHLLANPPKYQAFLASVGTEDMGYVVTYEAYTSFAAHTVMFLEDIFLLSEYRGDGLGRILFEHLATVAVRRGCGRMEWMVQDWNEGAIRFYERRGGRRVEGWHTFRIEEEGLKVLAEKAEAAPHTLELEIDETSQELDTQ